jgi:hypothetical protein
MQLLFSFFVYKDRSAYFASLSNSLIPPELYADSYWNLTFDIQTSIKIFCCKVRIEAIIIVNVISNSLGF